MRSGAFKGYVEEKGAVKKLSTIIAQVAKKVNIRIVNALLIFVLIGKTQKDKKGFYSNSLAMPSVIRRTSSHVVMWVISPFQ